MKPPRTFIFVGPTLPAEEILHALPDAQVLAPVGALDLLALDAGEGDTVAIIDGFFHSAPAVRHKEILVLLDRGVLVYGAASMGALRAAELAPCGMIGHGSVYAMFAHGLLVGDDEVAMLHVDASHGYRNVTEALVNVRFTCRRAMRRGFLSYPAGELVTQAAAALPFFERDWQRILKQATDLGLDPHERDRFESALDEVSVDVKRRDAASLLARLARERSTELRPPAERSLSPASANSWLRHWETEARGERVGDVFVSDADALTACRVLATDFEEIHRDATLQAAAAAIILPAADSQAAESVMRERDGLTAERDFDDWLKRRSMSSSEYRARAIGEVTVADYLGEHGPDALGELLLADLEARGIADRRHLQWLTSWFPGEDISACAPGTMIERLVARCPTINGENCWDAPVLSALRAHGALDAGRQAWAAAKEINDQATVGQPGFSPALLSAGSIGDWFTARWGISAERFEGAALDRGCLSAEGFIEAARHFYLLDRLDDRFREFCVRSADRPSEEVAQLSGGLSSGE